MLHLFGMFLGLGDLLSGKTVADELALPRGGDAMAICLGRPGETLS